MDDDCMYTGDYKGFKIKVKSSHYKNGCTYVVFNSRGEEVYGGTNTLGFCDAIEQAKEDIDGGSILNFEFSGAAARHIEELSKELNFEKAEVVKAAISLLAFAVNEHKNGSFLEFSNKKKNYRKRIEYPYYRIPWSEK